MFMCNSVPTTYKFGDVLGKDIYGREIKVGHAIDILTYYEKKVYVWRVIVIGITGNGNLRTLNIYKDMKGEVVANVTWEPYYKAFVADAGYLHNKPTTTWRHPAYYLPMNQYMQAGQPEEMLREILLDNFTEKQLRKMHYEL